MSSVELKTPVPVDVETRVRIEILHETIQELARGFMGGPLSKVTEEVIRKGFFERQYLESVTVYYLLDDGKMVGQAEINVDWKNYEVSLEANGENIELEKGKSTGKSLMEQISQVFPIFIWHMEQMSKAFGVKIRVVRYTYRDEILYDKEKLAEARAFLGTSPGEPIEWSDSGEKDTEGNNILGLSVTSGTLAELSVKVQSLSKPKKKD